jgi:hypothetical protein
MNRVEFKYNDGQSEVDIGLTNLVDAVKGKKISLFLQIWTRKCVYISRLTFTWSDTIRPCQNMHRNAPGVQILDFKNTFDSVCDEIRLEIQSRKFLRKHNLNEISYDAQWDVNKHTTCKSSITKYRYKKFYFKSDIYKQ